MESSIRKAKHDYNCRTGSVVTDNASNMAKMRRELETEDDEVVLTYGCSAHLLNLLAQDLTDHDTKRMITEVVKFLRNHQVPAFKYKNLGGTKLPIPIEIRWNSLVDTYEAFLRNYRIICQVYVYSYVKKNIIKYCIKMH